MSKYSSAMKHHLGNISRQTGSDVSSKYSYIISQDELVNAWVEAHNDLGYPLKKESYRDRYLIYNKQGLEKEIASIITNEILANLDELTSAVAEDIALKIEGMVSGLSMNHTINLTNGNSKTSSIATLIGKGVAKGIVKIAEETFKYD